MILGQLLYTESMNRFGLRVLQIGVNDVAMFGGLLLRDIIDFFIRESLIAHVLIQIL